jgi:hypothetical protein
VIAVVSTDARETFASVLVSVTGNNRHLGDYSLVVDKTGEIVDITKQLK